MKPLTYEEREELYEIKLPPYHRDLLDRLLAEESHARVLLREGSELLGIAAWSEPIGRWRARVTAILKDHA